MAGKVVDVTLRLVDRLSSPLNSIGGKLSQSANQWIKAGKQIQNAGKSISAVGSSMTKTLTVPIASAGVACVKLASDFEAGMSKVQSISGATGKELDALSQKAKEMGSKTKFSATEATEAYQYMAMAGWKAEDMMDGIEGIMYLAGATGEDLATTSDIVTDALTAFGMSAQDTEKFVDVLATTSSNANTNVSMMGESFKYVAPVAGALGYNVEDVSTALGLMANSGIKASTAGTSLRSWMSRMSAPTKQVQTAMDKLGISLTDSEGNMKDFKTLMQETKQSFAGLTEAQKSQYASALAGKTGMSGLLAIVNSSDEDFNKLSESIYNSSGACKEMYDVANDNLQGQLTILKSTVESIAISFGERLTPYVKKLVEWLQKLAEKFNGLSDKQKDMIIKVGLIVASIGPALLIFGKLVTGVGKVVSVVGKVGKAFKTFGSLMGIITSPAGIVIAVIAGIALAVFLIIKNWNKIKPVLLNVKKWFLESFGGANGAIAKFKDAFKAVVSTLAPIIQSIAKWFSEMIPKAVELFKKAFQKIVPIVINFIKGAIQKMTPVIKAVIKVVKELVPIIKNALAKAFQIIIPIIKTVIKVVGSVINVLAKNFVKCIDAVKPVLSAFGELFGVIFRKAGEKISAFWKFIKPIVTGIINTVMSIAKALQPAFQTAVEIVGGILKGFSDTVTTIFSGIMGVIKGIIAFITGVFTGNWRKAWEGVKSIFSSIFSSFASLAKQPINAVIGIINSAIRNLNRINVTIPDWVPAVGGKSFGINIPTIPTLAVGTDNWKGGLVQISEKGGEIVDLPSGSRVYPHDESVQQAYQDGAKGRSGGNRISISIPKLADQIVIREDSDIDKIAQKLADKLEKVSQNLGGGELGYLY